MKQSYAEVKEQVDKLYEKPKLTVKDNMISYKRTIPLSDKKLDLQEFTKNFFGFQ
jgi:hypothetical protein